MELQEFRSKKDYRSTVGKSYSTPSTSKQSNSKNVRVVARIRPMNGDEKKRGCLTGIHPIFPQNDEDMLMEPSSIPEPTTPPKRKTLRPFAFLSPAKKLSGLSSGAPHKTPTRLRLPPGQNGATPLTKNGLVKNGEKKSQSLTVGLSNQKHFDYDAVFDTTSDQREVYDRSVGDTVRRNIFQGYDTTIIAYGQTGSGKTYTMGGGQSDVDAATKQDITCLHNSKSLTDVFDSMPTSDFSSTNSSQTFELSEDDGIIPRAVHDLFKTKQLHESSAGEVSVRLTYLEIYNDELRDLLVDDNSLNSLKLRDNGKEGVMVDNLTTVAVPSAGHVKELMDKAATRRTTGSTRMNMTSSRSHAICSLLVTVKPAKCSNRSSSETIRAKLTLVDLAGSERLKQTGVMGIKKKESININKDLFVLAKVISALASKNKNGNSSKNVGNVHVPYRDSKLTRLLRDSLGGNCCTVMVACVSPAESNMEESMNTLRYAENARAIANDVKQNVEKRALSPSESTAMQQENKKLRCKVLEYRKRINALEDKSIRSTVEDSQTNPKENKGNGKAAVAGTSQKALGEADSGKLKFENLLPSTVVQGLDGEAYSDLSKVDLNTLETQRIEIIDLKNRLSRVSCDDDMLTTTSCLTYEMSLGDNINDDLTQESLGQEMILESLESRIREKQALVQDLETEAAILQDRTSPGSLERHTYALKMENRSLSAENKSVAESISSRKKELLAIEAQTRENTIILEEVTLKATQQKEELWSNIKEILDRKEKIREETERMQENIDRKASERTTLESAFIPTELVVEERKKHQEECNSKKNEIYKLKEQLQMLSAGSAEGHAKLKEAEIFVPEIVAQLNAEKATRVALEVELKIIKVKAESNADERDALRVQCAVKDDENLRLQKENLSSSIQKSKNDRLQKENENRSETALSRRTNRNGPKVRGVLSERNDCNKLVKNELQKPVRNNNDSVDNYPQFNKSSEPIQDEYSLTSEESDHDAVRVHAAKMLCWAERAINTRSTMSVVSAVSSQGTDFLPTMKGTMIPSVASCSKRQTPGLPPRKIEVPNQKVEISNLDEAVSLVGCTCQNSLFSGNVEHVDFFLPKLGMVCTCSKQIEQEICTDQNEDPMSLQNILRPWQVEFLETQSIRTAVELVHAFNQRGSRLAEEMRLWRKLKRLVSIKTKSCGIALHIWSRTCKAVTRNVRKQVSDGVKVPKKPAFLEVPADDKSVSTLGCGSIVELGPEIEV